MSVDVFVDETSRGIQGNLALVLEGPSLDRLGNTMEALGAVAPAAQRILPPTYRAPLSLRLRLAHTALEPSSATAEFRVKLRISQDALRGGCFRRVGARFHRREGLRGSP